MAIERERKFIVNGDTWRTKACQGTDICQGYLSFGPTHTVRIRIAGTQAFLTVKSYQATESRMEFEYPIPTKDACELLASLPESEIIAKTRHEISNDDKVWTIDVFQGTHEGLILAEIELNDNSPLNLPEWIGREVTGNPDYYNATLRVTTRPVTTMEHAAQEIYPK
jgi:CYTH domain-containing protein